MSRNHYKKARRKSDLLLRKLEDRILFDAAMDAGLEPNAGDASQGYASQNESAQGFEQDVATFKDAGEQSDAQSQYITASDSQGRRELVIVDTSVADYQQLVDDLLNNVPDSRNIAVVLLDAQADGVEQVSQILSGHRDLNALHLVSHGDNAAFRLGSTWVTADNLHAYAGSIVGWGNALNSQGDLLLYGCNLAESAEGKQLVDSLALLTATDVAASVDDTGSTSRGGDWNLEYSNGSLESTVVFSQNLQARYYNVLAVGPDVQFQNANQQVQIGENFNFTVTFQNTGTNVGYGPFVDLIFPVNGADGAAGTDTPDGIDFVGATYLGQPVNVIEVVFPDDGSGTGTIDHPFAVDNTGAPLQITGTAGDKLVVLELPFGSYAPGQPPADLVVTATTSNLADLDDDLIIQTRSGFRYGSDPLDNPTFPDPSIVSDAGTDVTDPDNGATSWTEQLSVTPTLLTLSKTFLGPENETATGPNHLQQYRIDVDIADGQTISNLDIIDSLPNNVVVTSIDLVTINGAATTAYTDNLGSLSFPGNNLDLILTPDNPVTGGTSNADVSVTFSFYVAEFDANGNRVIRIDGEDDTIATPDSRSFNNARAVGDWTPIDTRDTGGIDNAVADPDTTGPEHILDDKAIAIQKSVSIVNDTGTSGATPGDTLEYVLNFQISDYYTFGDLIIDDVFQDGQLFDFGYGATFDVTDMNGNVTGSFTVRQITDPDVGETLVVDQTKINYADNGTEDGVTSDGSDGSTTLRFDLSQALIANLAADGVLQGGLSDGATNGGAASGTIRFRTIIQEDYADTFASGDRSVDQGDNVTNNSLTITGTVRENSEENGGTGDITSVLGSESDTSSAGVVIRGGTLLKEIYAINGSTTLPIGDTGKVTLRPGDTVTYRIEYALATSDVENLTITDYLPLPIFNIDDHNADGVGGDSWTFDSDATFDGIAGTVEVGVNDTFFALSGISPTITLDTGSNGLGLYYGDFDDPASQSSTIEVYLTIAAQDIPTADGLFLTNIVRASEGTTNNGSNVQDQIVQIEVLQPELSITKGVISSSESGASFTGVGVGPVGFEDPASVNPAFTTGFTSSDLASNPINSDISLIDAGDLVKFAIVIENTGGADAFDLTISDIRAAGFEIPSMATGLNLEVRDGNGNLLTWTGVDTGTDVDLFAGGILISDPVGEGAINNIDDATAASDGSNIVVITYDLELKDSVTANEALENTALLTNYAGQEGGIDYTTIDRSDNAFAMIRNHSSTKSIVSTSESHTTAVTGIERVTIGEIVRYRIEVALPEGTFINLQILDVLAGGLTYIDDGTALVALVSDTGSITSTMLAGAGLSVVGNESNLATITPTFQLPDVAISASATNHDDNFTTGQGVFFTLGDVVNTDDDANVEYVILEFNALVDNNNTGSHNDVDETRYNDVRVYQNGSQIYDMPEANRPRVIIAEPLVQNINKTGDIASGDAGDTVTYTVTFDVAAGDNRSDAFNVRLLDSLPTDLTFGSLVSVQIDGLPAAFTNNSAGNTLDIIFDRVNKTEAVEVVYTATIDIAVTPEKVLTNDAQLTWSSLADQFGTADGTGGNNTGSDLATLNGFNTDNGNGETASIVYNTTSGSEHGERDGSSGPGVNPNDYADNDTHTVTIEGVTAFTKTVVDTEFNDAFNGLTDAVIGELVTYEINIAFPEGTTPNAVIVDTMDDELAFVGMVSASINDLNITGSTTPMVGGNGRVLTFDFGTVTDADISNDTDGSITLRFQAVVLNVSGNQTGTAIDNSAEFTWNSNPGTSVIVDAPDLNVREAQLDVNKSVEVNPPSGSTVGDGGDPVRYTIVIQNTGPVDAFDVIFSDALPTVGAGTSAILGATFNVVDSMGGGLTNADFTLSGNDATGYTLSLNGTTNLDLLKSQGARTITITIDGTIPSTLGPNDVVNNDAIAEWTSLDGVVGNRSTYTTDDSGERDGTNSTDNTHDYTDTGSASFSIAPPVFNKSLFATDQTETTGSDVTIGERVTYALLVTLPEGTTAGLDVTDQLPTGLNYENFQLVQTITGSGGLLTADFNGAIQGGDPIVTGGAGDGDDVTFTFGQINVAIDNDPGNNSFVILFTAVVSDVGTNVGYNPGRTTLGNTATIDVIGDGQGATTSNQVDVDVVESNLVITKDIDKTKADADELLTITLTVDNNGLGDAYEVILQDILSSTDYDLSSVNLGSSGVAYPVDFTASFNAGTGMLEYNGGTIAAGATASFTFTVELSDTVAPGDTIVNTATITQATTLQGVEAGERNAPDPDGDGSDTSQDSVDVRTNSLSGNVYFDADNDGTFDGSETGIANVDIRLQGTDHLGNAVDITVQTAADGSYLFEDLRPGTYSITETQPITAPSGKDYLDGIDTIGTQGGNDSVNDLFFNIALPTGTETDGTGNNFAELEEAELNGFVWHDADNDGVFDLGEQSIGGVDVTLTGTDDQGVITPITVTTAVDGSYTFDGLRPGQYTITQTQPTFAAPSGRDYADGIDVDGSLANGDITTNDVISSIDVAAADEGNSYNFAEVVESVVSGYVYHDSNNDGIRTAETGIQNVSVTLTGVDDLGNAVNLTTMTDINGFYEFANLRPSDASGYTITQTQPATYLDGVDTLGTPGGDDTVNDVYSNITITSDTAGSENNFGELVPASLGGTVFNDHNNDGTQDAGETGIAGVTITLSGTDDLGNLVNVSVITDVNGNYQFTNVRPSDIAGYTLTETQPTNYNDGLDSDGSLANGDATINDAISSINVNSGDNGTGYDFAEQGTSITGTVYVDDDRDGTLGGGEPTRIGGVVIELWDAAGTTLLDSTVTLADGTYRFDYLPTANYQIRQIHPSEYSSTSADTLNVSLPAGGLTDQDFGEALWDLGDTIWFDADNDGVQDPGEEGLANVDVTLLYAGADGVFATTGDNVTLNATTDASGFYSFTEQFNGEYRLTVDSADLPSGVAGTMETDDSSPGIDGISNITVGGGDRFDVDFGFAGSGTIGDFVFLDVDGDGTQDPEDKGLANVTVNILFAGADGSFGNDDDLTFATVTDANGMYSVNHLPSGDFRVNVSTADPDLPGSIVGISGPQSNSGTVNVTLADGETNNDLDFGFAGTLTLGDRLWFDGNGDGVQDLLNEPGFANVEVTLNYSGQDGIFGNGDDVVLTDTTDGSGNFGFGSLAEGEYRITYNSADLPGGMTGTFETDDSAAAIDGTANITLNGLNRNDVDFGFRGAGSISDFVWHDVNNDGMQDPGEPGLANIDVDMTFAGTDGLFGTADDFSLETTTDANGLYSFASLPDGNYQIDVDASDPNMPGDMLPVVGPESISGTANVTLDGVIGRNQNDIDFGFSGTNSIGDFVWFDANGDGNQDTGEPGLVNTTVVLTSSGQDGVFGNADDVTIISTTDVNGFYTFENLPSVEYRIDVTGEPGGMNQTAETDDGANLIPGVAEIQLAIGESQDNVDFGFVGTGSIGDTIFFDEDGNGVQDPGEVGFPDVNIELQIDFDGDSTFDHSITTTTDASGNYLFSNLPASNYIVTVSAPSGTNQTADPDATLDNVSTLTLGAGENNTTRNFGYQGTGSIGDSVFWDQDANGFYDADEIGIQNVGVQLNIDLDQNGTTDLVLNTTTDVNGNYTFDNLPVGNYTVTVTPKAGTAPTFDKDGTLDNASAVTLGAGQNDDSHDFGYRGTASIGDKVYFDKIGDGGPFDPVDDRGMPGVDVTLEIDVDGDGTADFTQIDTTDANGDFSFDHLIDGDYTITVNAGDLPDAMGGNPTYNLDGTIDDTTDVTLGVSEVNNDVDFGYHATPDYAITKDDGLSDVMPGQSITYTITLTNNGTLRGQNVVVTDTFPTSILENISVNLGGIVDTGAGTVTWNLPSVGMGDTVILTITANVIDPLATAITSLTNDVNVADDGFFGIDPNPVDNFDDDIDTVTAQPDYQLIKSNDLTGPAIPGQTFQYFLQVVNNGNQDGTGVVVSDTLPLHVLDGFSVITDDPANVIYDPITGDLTWNAGSIGGSGGTRTLTVTATVQDPVSTLVASFDNSATVMDNGANGADPNLFDNNSTSTAGLDATPDYEIVKNSNLTDTAMVGDSFEYTITVTNNGNQNGTGVVVTDYLPVTVVNRNDVTTSEPANVSYDSATGELIWSVGDLNGRGNSATLTIQVTIPFVIEDPLADTIVNTATVVDDGANGPDLNPSNNSSTVTDDLLVFAFDSFNNFRQPFFRSYDDGFLDDEADEISRTIRPVPVDPIFSGLAEPGTTLKLLIYDAGGNVVGERQVVADAGGNWLANFPNVVVWKHPHRMEVEQTAPIQSEVDQVDGFNMRRYFHPATHHSLFFTERDTVQSVERNLAYQTIEAMHEANIQPLQVGWRNHLYQLNVSSTNAAAK